jgi:3-hydroxyacyl-CoA dehydrogenase
VVVERLDIKQQVLANVEKYRTPGTLITTNTSGIPIHAIARAAATISASTSAARTSSTRRATCPCWS